MFYLTPYQRDVETTPVPAKVSLSTLFPAIGKRKVKPTQVKISDCGLPALKKPLRLLNSLLLLRTDSNTIPLNFVERLVGAFNGQRTDWQDDLYSNMRVEMLLLHRQVFRSEGEVATASMIGPHLTLLLATQGHMSVDQEKQAGIWKELRKILGKPREKKQRIGASPGKGMNGVGTKPPVGQEVVPAASKAVMIIELNPDKLQPTQKEIDRGPVKTLEQGSSSRKPVQE